MCCVYFFFLVIWFFFGSDINILFFCLFSKGNIKLVSAFADDITVFVSRRLDIKAVKKAVSEYERIAGAKVNFDKSEGLRLGAWRGSDTLPGPFRWSDGPVRILGVWFGWEPSIKGMDEERIIEIRAVSATR